MGIKDLSLEFSLLCIAASLHLIPLHASAADILNAAETEEMKLLLDGFKQVDDKSICPATAADSKVVVKEEEFSYVCEMDETQDPAASGSPTPTDSPKNELGIIHKNDNFGPRNGNDLGDTFALYLKYQRQMKKNATLSASVGTQLFSKEAETDFDYNRARELLETGQATHVLREGFGNRHPINYIDVTEFYVSLLKGKDIKILLALGAQYRRTTPGGLASQIQDGWHHIVKAPFYFYSDSRGHASETKMNTDGSAVMKNGILPDKDAKNLPPLSILFDIGIQKPIVLAKGRCVVTPNALLHIATEGKQVFGQNSYIKAGVLVEGAALQKKNGQPRVVLSADAAASRYLNPVKSDARPDATELNFKVKTYAYVGKNKTHSIRLELGVDMTGANSYQQYQPYNDAQLKRKDQKGHIGLFLTF